MSTKKIRMYMGIPSTGTRSDLQCYVLRELEERYKEHIEFVYPSQCAHRIFHDFARNAIAQEFLDSNCDVLWFLDSDVAPPKYVLDLITMHWDKWKVAGAPYPIFMSVPGSEGPQIVFTAYKKGDDGKLRPGKIPYSGVAEVDALATGCLFIKREVLEKMPQPWFEFKYDPTSRCMVEGEDLGFCLKASELGYKFFTDYSMVCKHYKNVDLLDINNYAIDYSNTSVKAYDASIKQTMADALAAAYTRGKRDALKESGRTASGLILPGYER